MEGFIGQEEMHGREHRVLNEHLADMGYPTRGIGQYVKGLYWVRERIQTKRVNLAFTAALEHVTAERHEQMRREITGTRSDLGTEAIVSRVFDLFTGPLFRAALMLWVAAAAEPQLRDQVVPLEARIGREVHRVVVDLLGVDEGEPGVRETVQATLDLARGLGLANLLTDDGARRRGIAQHWAAVLDATLR